MANTAITTAPPASRAMTAAVGLQPASINALAKGPDMPKLSAEASANAMPSRKSVAGFAISMSASPRCNE